jgi:PadR family transcriptional regulator AphA
MSLKHALLGFLNYKSMTGYQLKQSFDKSVRNFWNASLSQIYPTLGQMKDDGLLTLEIKYQDSSPNAKIYHITDKGREELQKWISEPMEPQRHRSAFLIKLFFGANIDKDLIISQLKHRLELAEDNLEKYQQIMNDMTKNHALENDLTLFESLTVDFGIKNMEAVIVWCKESIEKIESIKIKET